MRRLVTRFSCATGIACYWASLIVALCIGLLIVSVFSIYSGFYIINSETSLLMDFFRHSHNSAVNESCKCDEASAELYYSEIETPLAECLTKIEALEYELGECHLEWGACEQVGQQKTKLDEARLQEIQRLKKKFSVCLNRLRHYKSLVPSTPSPKSA